MVSENYQNQNKYNQGDEWKGTGGNKDPYRHMDKRPFVNKAAPNIYNAAKNPYDHLPPDRQLEAQDKLAHYQRDAQKKFDALKDKNPNLAKNLAAQKPSALVGLAKNLLSQIRWSVDWLFIILASFAFLKDIFDIAFGGSSQVASSYVAWIPIFGQATAYGIMAAGATVSFVFELLLIMFCVVVLVLTGSSLRNRGMAKYFLGIGIAFISEAFPGISLLPLAFIETLVLYGFVLFDRAYMAQGNQTVRDTESDVPTQTAADNYQESAEQLAA